MEWHQLPIINYMEWHQLMEGHQLSSADRKRADDEFLANGIKSSKQYAWYRPRRYAVIKNAKRFYAALRMGGFATREAHKK